MITWSTRDSFKHKLYCTLFWCLITKFYQEGNPIILSKKCKVQLKAYRCGTWSKEGWTRSREIMFPPKSDLNLLIYLIISETGLCYAQKRVTEWHVVRKWFKLYQKKKLICYWFYYYAEKHQLNYLGQTYRGNMCKYWKRQRGECDIFKNRSRQVRGLTYSWWANVPGGPGQMLNHPMQVLLHVK